MTSVDEVDPPLQLLVVEDNPTDRSWLVLMLEGADLCPHREAYAETLATAEVMLRDEAFDCVLLDLRLPDGDGVESVERVVGTAPDTPVVVFTGRTERDLGLAAIEAGAQDFLVKGQVTGNAILQAARWARVRHGRRPRWGADGPTIPLTALTAPWAWLGADLVVVATSGGFARAIGYQGEDLRGRRLLDVLEGVPDPRAATVLGQVASGELEATTVALPAVGGDRRFVAARAHRAEEDIVVLFALDVDVEAPR